MTFAQLYGTELDRELGSEDTSVLFTTVLKDARASGLLMRTDAAVERRAKALQTRDCRRCGKTFVVGGAGNPHKRRIYCSFPCSYPKRTLNGMKQCARCLQSKPATREHYRSMRKSNDGLHCWCIACFESYRRAKHVSLRAEVMAHYSRGVPTCSCCGERGLHFLTMDHINGGGNKHRREIGNASGTLLSWIKRNGYPDGFQVLCWNCNLAKAHHGQCPHGRA